MANKVKYKYILNPGVSGDLWTKAPDGRKEGGKFSLTPELSQTDMSWLYDQGHSDVISRVGIPDEPAKAKKLLGEEAPEPAKPKKAGKDKE